MRVVRQQHFFAGRAVVGRVRAGALARRQEVFRIHLGHLEIRFRRSGIGGLLLGPPPRLHGLVALGEKLRLGLLALRLGRLLWRRARVPRLGLRSSALIQRRLPSCQKILLRSLPLLLAHVGLLGGWRRGHAPDAPPRRL